MGTVWATLVGDCNKSLWSLVQVLGDIYVYGITGKVKSTGNRNALLFKGKSCVHISAPVKPVALAAPIASASLVLLSVLLFLWVPLWLNPEATVTSAAFILDGSVSLIKTKWCLTS